ncbi:MAG TPA: 4-hydroxy-tetrahydrodipicolinate reductase [Terriglobia bacterium]|nr:4-hydroxy-tetrahydrodipicolinate reductase [Terriglobia bacterium]
MNIALIGYGKMGHEIEAVAKEQGDTIVEIFDIDRTADAASLKRADVCIEFSAPDAAVRNILTAVDAGVDIVVGTTGWYAHLDEIRGRVRNSALLYSANFSLGVNLYFRIVARAAELMNNATDYDAYVHEWHHRQKADSPSGTALRLAEILLNRIDRKKSILRDRSDGKIDPASLHVTSTRVGTVPGTHTVAFDSDADQIEITHIARNRRGFALGALRAAHWAHGRKGVFTMDDVEL